MISATIAIKKIIIIKIVNSPIKEERLVIVPLDNINIRIIYGSICQSHYISIRKLIEL